MPIVHVYMWSSLSKETKARIVKNITRVFEDLGTPAHAVEVIIHETPRENWALGGELASEKFREIRSS